MDRMAFNPGGGKPPFPTMSFSFLSNSLRLCVSAAIYGLPIFLGDVFEDGFDGGNGVGAVGLLEGNVAIAAE